MRDIGENSVPRRHLPNGSPLAQSNELRLAKQVKPGGTASCIQVNHGHFRREKTVFIGVDKNIICGVTEKKDFSAFLDAYIYQILV